MSEVVARTVWVGGLPKDIDEDALRAEFGGCGRIENVNIKQSKVDTFAFITYEYHTGCKKALNTLDQSTVFGRPMKVNVVSKKPGAVEPGNYNNDSRGYGAGGGGGGRDYNNDRDWSNVHKTRDNGYDRSYDDGDRHRQDDRGREARERNASRGYGAGGGGGGGRDYSNDRDWSNVHKTRDDGYDRSYDDGDRHRQDDRGREARERNASRGYGAGGGGGVGGGRDYSNDRDWSNAHKTRDNGYDRSYDDGDRHRQDDRGREARERSQGSYRQDAQYKRRGARGDSRVVDRGGYRSPPKSKDFEDQGSRVWVGGLPQDITEREIERTFSTYGETSEILIKRTDADTFCYVQYKNASHAEDAITDLNLTDHFGGNIRVQPASRSGKKGKDSKGDGKGGKGGKKGKKNWRPGSQSRSPRRPPRRSRSPRGKGNQSRMARGSGIRFFVKLGNLPPDMDAEELGDLGDAYGKVVNADVWQDSRSRSNSGMIQYTSRDDAVKALNDLNDRRMDGWDKHITACLEQKDG